MPLVRGRWVELRAEFDLGPRTVDVFYDNFVLASNEFSRGGHRIEAVSIYGGEPGHGTSGIYVDDVSFDPIDTCEPCDMNCNGEVDAGDIDPFFLALIDLARHQAQYPECHGEWAGDVNQDGVFDGADIDAFFELIGG